MSAPGVLVSGTARRNLAPVALLMALTASGGACAPPSDTPRGAPEGEVLTRRAAGNQPDTPAGTPLEYAIRQQGDWEMIARAKLMTQAMIASGNDTQAILASYKKLDTAFTKSLPQNQNYLTEKQAIGYKFMVNLVGGTLESLADVSKIGKLGGGVIAATDDLAKDSLDYAASTLSPSKYASAGAALAARLQTLEANKTRLLGNLSRLCADSRAREAACNAVFAGELKVGAFVDDSWTAFTSRNSSNLPPAVQTVLQKPDPTADDLDQAAAALLSQTGPIAAQARAAPADSAAAQTLHRNIEAFNAAANALAALANRVAPGSDLALALGGVGNATSLVLQGSSMIAQATKATGLAAGFFMSGGIALTATAVLSVYDLFAKKPPAAQSALTAQLARLADEITRMRAENRQYYEAISAQVGNLAQAVEAGFADLSRSAQAQVAFSEATAHQISTLRDQVASGVRGLFLALDAGFQRDFEDRSSMWLASPHLAVADLQDAQRYLSLVVDTFATDDLAIYPPALALPAPGTLASEVAVRSPYHNLDLTRRWLSAQHQLSIGNGPLPNLTYWDVGARLALILASRATRSDLEAAGTAAVLDHLLATGQALRHTLRRLVLGPDGGTSPLALIAGDLQAQLGAVATQAQAAEDRIRATRIPQAAGVDLFAPAAQPAPAVGNITVTRCSGSGSWSLPADAVRAFVPPQALIAQQLGLGTLTLCTDVSGYTNRHGGTCIALCPGPFVTSCCTRQTNGTPILDLRADIAGATVASRRVVAGTDEKADEVSPDIITRAWPSVVSSLTSGGATNLLTDTTALDKLTANTSAEIGRLRGSWLDGLASEAENGTPLGLAVDQVQGSRALIDDMLTVSGQRLSDDRIVTALDGPVALNPSRAWLATFYRGFGGPGAPTQTVADRMTTWGVALKYGVDQMVMGHAGGDPLLLSTDLTLMRLASARSKVSPFYTPAGDAVEVGAAPATASVTLAHVAAEGETQIAANLGDVAPWPPRFTPLDAALVSTTATHDGTATICFDLPKLSADDQARVRLAVLSGPAWSISTPPATDLSKAIACIDLQLPVTLAVGELKNSAPVLMCRPAVPWTPGMALPEPGNIASVSDPENDSVSLELSVVGADAAGVRVRVTARDTEGAVATCESLLGGASVNAAAPDAGAGGPQDARGTADVGSAGSPEPPSPTGTGAAEAGAAETGATEAGGAPVIGTVNNVPAATGCACRSGGQEGGAGECVVGLMALLALLRSRRGGRGNGVARSPS